MITNHFKNLGSIEEDKRKEFASSLNKLKDNLTKQLDNKFLELETFEINERLKDQKIDIMHIAVCRLLEPYGFYEFDYVDKDGWPHYKTINKLPNLKSGEQSILMKESIINYFIEKQLIE